MDSCFSPGFCILFCFLPGLPQAHGKVGEISSSAHQPHSLGPPERIILSLFGGLTRRAVTHGSVCWRALVPAALHVPSLASVCPSFGLLLLWVLS